MIGISVGRLPPGRRDRDGTDHDYGAAVVLAGGSPVLLPATTGSDLEAVTSRLDGLLLSGGGDVDPARYRAPVSPATGGVDGVRDGVEVELLRGALAQHLPVLAICRGVQLLNVALGGTLHQHLPDFTDVDHYHPEPRWFPAHPVAIEAGSALREVVGVDQLEVNSMHHQAVDALAPGLRVSARAPDGIVEAVEDADRRLLGVQWHPENLAATGGPHLALFGWLTRPQPGGRQRAGW